jgi:hypothetical protein
MKEVNYTSNSFRAVEIQRETSSFVTLAFVQLISPPVSCIPLQSHMPLTDAARPISNAIFQE